MHEIIDYALSTAKVLQIQRERIILSLGGVLNVTNLALLTAVIERENFTIQLVE